MLRFLADRPEEPADVRSNQRVAGLDTLRSVCALFVLFGHFGFAPLLVGVPRTTPIGRIVNAAYDNLICGPAAVIVFFLISGFCIHYPYRNGRAPLLGPYFVRRYVRILVPMGVAIAFGIPLGLELENLNDSILWSLLAEEIYYLLYAFVLLPLRRRWSFSPLIALSYGLGLLIVAGAPQAGNYASHGAGLTWLLGLPCWLLGCLLAESPERAPPSSRRLWALRLSVLGLSSLAMVLRFHSALKYPLTLNLFAFAAFVWLRQEIAHYAREKPPRWLETNGKWSYSLYLFHVPAHALFARLAVPSLGPMADWALTTAFVLFACYGFHRLVERPSHAAARRLGALARVQRVPAGFALHQPPGDR